MLLAGLVKLQAQCPSWNHLMALDYHFATQCIPTPLAWFAHQLPPIILRFSVGATLVIEIPLAFLLIAPFSTVRRVGVLAQVFLQVCILLSGNYTFFNLLTILLMYQCWLSDEEEGLLESQSSSGSSISETPALSYFRALTRWNRSCSGKNIQLLLSSLVIAASFVWMLRMDLSSSSSLEWWRGDRLTLAVRWENLSSLVLPSAQFVLVTCLLHIVGLTLVGMQQTMQLDASDSPALMSFFGLFESFGLIFPSQLQSILAQIWLSYLVGLDLLFGLGQCLYLCMSALSLASVCGVKDIVPSFVQSFHSQLAPFRLTSEYGLFRALTGMGPNVSPVPGSSQSTLPFPSVARPELVLEGLDSRTNEWKEIHLKYKPGPLNQAPPVIAPLQPRLDWQFWFAALGSFQHNPWLLALCDKILNMKSIPSSTSSSLHKTCPAQSECTNEDQRHNLPPDLMSLLDESFYPFRESPPSKIRVLQYEYDMTHYNSSWSWANPSHALLSSSVTAPTRDSSGHMIVPSSHWWTRSLRTEYIKEAPSAAYQATLKQNFLFSRFEYVPLETQWKQCLDLVQNKGVEEKETGSASNLWLGVKQNVRTLACGTLKLRQTYGLNDLFYRISFPLFVLIVVGKFISRPEAFRKSFRDDSASAPVESAPAPPVVTTSVPPTVPSTPTRSPSKSKKINESEEKVQESIANSPKPFQQSSLSNAVLEAIRNRKLYSLPSPRSSPFPKNSSQISSEKIQSPRKIESFPKGVEIEILRSPLLNAIRSRRISYDQTQTTKNNRSSSSSSSSSDDYNLDQLLNPISVDATCAPSGSSSPEMNRLVTTSETPELKDDEQNLSNSSEVQTNEGLIAAIGSRRRQSFASNIEMKINPTSSRRTSFEEIALRMKELANRKKKSASSSSSIQSKKKSLRRTLYSDSFVDSSQSSQFSHPQSTQSMGSRESDVPIDVDVDADADVDRTQEMVAVTLLEAACSQISVDSFARELTMQGVDNKTAQNEAEESFLSRPSSFSPKVTQSPRKDIYSSPRKTFNTPSKTKSDSIVPPTPISTLLQTIEESGMETEREKEKRIAREILSCSLISCLSDAEMESIDRYAAQLKSLGVGKKSTVEGQEEEEEEEEGDDGEAYALAMDAFLRGIEKAFQYSMSLESNMKNTEESAFNVESNPSSSTPQSPSTPKFKTDSSAPSSPMVTYDMYGTGSYSPNTNESMALFGSNPLANLKEPSSRTASNEHEDSESEEEYESQLKLEEGFSTLMSIPEEYDLVNQYARTLTGGEDGENVGGISEAVAFGIAMDLYSQDRQEFLTRMKEIQKGKARTTTSSSSTVNLEPPSTSPHNESTSKPVTRRGKTHQTDSSIPVPVKQGRAKPAPSPVPSPVPTHRYNTRSTSQAK